MLFSHGIIPRHSGQNAHRTNHARVGHHSGLRTEFLRFYPQSNSLMERRQGLATGRRCMLPVVAPCSPSNPIVLVNVIVQSAVPLPKTHLPQAISKRQADSPFNSQDSSQIGASRLVRTHHPHRLEGGRFRGGSSGGIHGHRAQRDRLTHALACPVDGWMTQGPAVHGAAKTINMPSSPSC